MPHTHKSTYKIPGADVPENTVKPYYVSSGATPESIHAVNEVAPPPYHTAEGHTANGAAGAAPQQISTYLAPHLAAAVERNATNNVAPQSPPLPRHDKATRIAALMKMGDLWQESGNGYVDGVEYQKEMRAEWR